MIHFRILYMQQYPLTLSHTCNTVHRTNEPVQFGRAICIRNRTGFIARTISGAIYFLFMRYVPSACSFFVLYFHNIEIELKSFTSLIASPK